MDSGSARRALRTLLRASLCLAVAWASLASAQTWSGPAGGAKGSPAGNWVGGTAPASSPATNLIFPSPPCVVDFPWTVGQIFAGGPLALSGQALPLGQITA